jgi:hypothetical protein
MLIAEAAGDRVDTRQKIKSPADMDRMLVEGSWTIVSGEFDPLTCAIAEQLESLKPEGSRLLAIVRTSPEQLLDANARAIMMAGLRSVDAVLVQNADDRTLRLSDHAGATFIDFTAADRCARQKFEQIVLSRDSSVTQV